MNCPSRLLVAAAVAASACHPGSRPLASPAAASASRAVLSLHQQIDGVLADPALQRGYWGVLVRSLRTGDTLYALNAAKLMMPASNMKIVTLAAAADRLGWDFTFDTRLLAIGPVTNGVLDGDLLVAGSGDPSLTGANAAAMFDDWAGCLRSIGILRVTGRILGDDGAFDHEPLGMGWSWDDLPDGYATGIGALQYNENVVRVVVTPGATAGSAAVVSAAPDGSGLQIRNDVITSPAQDTNGISLHRLPGSSVLELRGSIQAGAAARTFSVSVPNPTLFFVTTLRAALIARGIDVLGPAMDVHDAPDALVGPNATLVGVHRSPPLSMLAATMMKLSQNLYAETLLKRLGAAEGAPATIAAGRRAVAATLDAWGIPAGSVIERDGSGLSRYNFVTPEALVAILTHVDRDQTLSGPFEAALPVEGVEGTLARRGTGTPSEGRVRAKTGSMSNVRALSGYVTDADGEPLVFSIIANNFEAAPQAVNSATDAIVARIAAFSR